MPTQSTCYLPSCSQNHKEYYFLGLQTRRKFHDKIALFFHMDEFV